MKKCKTTLYLLLAIVFFANCSSKMSKKQIEDIEKNGIESSGVVVKLKFNSTTINNYETKNYIVVFDFEHNGQTLLCEYSLGKDEETWKKFEVGMRYKIKYLDLAEKTSENAIIYYQHPLNEFRNKIEEEKDRIKKLYK